MQCKLCTRFCFMKCQVKYNVYLDDRSKCVFFTFAETTKKSALKMQFCVYLQLLSLMIFECLFFSLRKWKKKIRLLNFFKENYKKFCIITFKSLVVFFFLLVENVIYSLISLETSLWYFFSQPFWNLFRITCLLNICDTLCMCQSKNIRCMWCGTKSCTVFKMCKM